MSKMRVPEMDVVRFKESDVIVASGLEASTIKLTLSGFADSVEGNGRITYKNTTYDWGSAVNLLFELGEVGITEYFRIGEDSRIELLYKADLQEAGLSKWTLCKKYQWLKSFAFIYAFFRLLIKGATAAIHTKNVKKHIMDGKNKYDKYKKIGIRTKNQKP